MILTAFGFNHKPSELLNRGYVCFPLISLKEPTPASSRQHIGLPFWETLARELLLALSHAHYLAFWPWTLPVFFLAPIALMVLSQHRPYLV
jgi:hypothetical protein